MADEKIDIILDFQVKQGDAIAQLERQKLSILGLKEEQQNLSKAYKAAQITQAEYAKELVRVEAILKKQTTDYNTLSKATTGTQSATDKLTKALKDHTQGLTIAGTNVGALTGLMSKLLTPVGAAVGLVTALGAAYAKSASGAKDLAFASNEIGAALQIVSNGIGDLFNKSKEDGEWFFSSVVSGLIGGINPVLAIKAKQQAKIIEDFEDLQRKQIQIQETVNERLAANQELLTEINEEETTHADKLLKIDQIEENLRLNQDDQVGVLKEQLTLLENQNGKVHDQEALDTKILEKKAEISKVIATTSKKIEATERSESNIETANRKQLAIQKEKLSDLEAEIRLNKRLREIQGLNPALSPSEALRKEVDAEKILIQERKDFTIKAEDAMAKAREAIAKRQEAQNKNQLEFQGKFIESREIERDSLRLFSQEAGHLYGVMTDDSRRAAGIQLLINAGLTLSGIVKNTAQLGPIAGPLYAGAAIVAASAAIAQAANLIGVNGNLIGNVSFASAAADGGLSQDEAQVLGLSPRFAKSVNLASSFLIHPLKTARKLLKGGFSEGGYTGPGGLHEPAGMVHAGEVVWNQRDVAAIGGPAIANAMRPTYKGYEDGGIVANVSTARIDSDLRLLSLVRALPPDVVDLREVYRGIRKIESKEQANTR